MNLNEWDKLTANFENSKIYHLYEWGVLLNKVCNHKIFYLTESEGIFPLALIKSRLFGDRLISLPFADYGGPLATGKDTIESLVSKSIKLAHGLNLDFMEIRCPDQRYFEIFETQGFIRREDYFTYILHLNNNLDELWKNIGDKNRNMVRKAEKNNVQIKVASTENDLKEFYYLYLKTMKKLGSPPQPYQYFGNMWQMFYPQHLILPMATYENKCIACGIFFLYNRTIHHAYSCISRQYLNLAPNDLIQWWMIKWGTEQGYVSLDSGRTRAGAGNVLFKKRWGGKCVVMPYFYKFFKHELDERQEIKYKNLSKLWSKYVPNAAANRIGPWIIKQIG